MEHLTRGDWYVERVQSIDVQQSIRDVLELRSDIGLLLWTPRFEVE